MKPATSYPKHRAKFYLASCLAALFAVATLPVQAQTTDQAALDTDDDVEVLSPFEVKSEKDYGYLKTNASTASRIGMEIQKVPMNVQVLSSEFIADTGMRDFVDLFKYTASSSGDQRFAVLRPSNEATPQGGMTLRGFPINIILRNGVLLYSTKSNFDNVDRVEIVKGPAAVFFGQGYPGGVINYITKRASLNKIPTTLKHVWGDNNVNRLTLDSNNVLSKKAAIRIVGHWEGSGGERSYEFTKRFSYTPSIVLVPFEDAKLLKLTFEHIYLKEKFNKNDFAWIFPDAWFTDYANPSAAMIAASGQTTADGFRGRIFASIGNWRNYMRIATGNPKAPLYVGVKQGAYYTDAGGTRVQSDAFNFHNAGAYVDNEQSTSSFVVESQPLDWVNVRYVFTKDKTNFNTIEGRNYPNADGKTFNSLSGGNGAGYYRKTKAHQLDVVFDMPELFGVKSKVLVGYNYQKYLQQYFAPAANTSPLLWQVPGYNYPTTNSVNFPTLATGWNVPNLQVLRDRDGNIMSASDVYRKWDPGVHPHPPPADKVFPINRNLLDGYRTQYNNWYVNFQGEALDGRLNLLAGFRREKKRDNGQHLTSNYPWFAVPNYAFADTVTYDPAVYSYSPSYAGSPGNFVSQTGDSWMYGATFEVVKDVNVYASASSTFRFNNNTQLGGYDEITFPAKLAALLAAPINAGGITYPMGDGTTRLITTVAEGLAAIDAAGGNRRAENESGINYEVGVKTSLYDNKLVTTIAMFRLTRKNQMLDDSYRQSNDTFNRTVTDTYTRNFRWRGNDATNRIEGLEIEGTWTPIRNFQSVTNFSWLYTAKTISNPSVVPTNVNYALHFGERIENVPEFRFNSYNKYTFSDGPIRGASVALGLSSSSEMNIGRTIDWGYKSGDYMVFDLIFGYPWELAGYKIQSTLGIYNLTDEFYLPGGYVPGPKRTWTMSNTITF